MLWVHWHTHNDRYRALSLRCSRHPKPTVCVIAIGQVDGIYWNIESGW
jgi:hypothetical protein